VVHASCRRAAGGTGHPRYARRHPRNETVPFVTHPSRPRGARPRRHDPECAATPLFAACAALAHALHMAGPVDETLLRRTTRRSVGWPWSARVWLVRPALPL